MKRLVVLVGIIGLLVAACGPGAPPPPSSDPSLEEIATMVSATLQAQATEQAQSQNDPPPEAQSTITATTPADAPTAESPTATTETNQNGTVIGTVCYPSEGIPPMTVYLHNLISNQFTEVPIAQNQSTFSQELSPGTYKAFAWLPGFSYGGSFSQAVPCGLNVNCSDHSLIEFSVNTGEETSGVDVCDWYGSPGDVPYPPGVSLEDTLGAISGDLGYPSEGIPSLSVVAFNQDTGQWWSTTTQQNQTSYKISDLPPGNYFVVAYPVGSDYGGGYSEFVPCGLSVDCPSHALINVVVTGGQTTEGINPVDFYALEGAFPLNPDK